MSLLQSLRHFSTGNLGAEILYRRPRRHSRRRGVRTGGAAGVVRACL